MTLISVGITFTVECSHCRSPLPVNQATEGTLCSNCWNVADTSRELWQHLIAERLAEASAMEPEKETWATGMIAGLGDYRVTYGNLAPRCVSCSALLSLESLLARAKEGDTKFSCSACGSISNVRMPPTWFGMIAPQGVLLIGETAPDESGALKESAEGISIRCYHCGGPLPLEGAGRTIKCRHCGQDLIVPDDIWQRLHPVITAHTWYVLLNTVEDAVMLPGDIDEFLDLAALPGGDTALLWKKDSVGFIGRAGRNGTFRWVKNKIVLSDNARLLFATGQDLLWVLDRDEDIVQAFRVESGGSVVTIRKEKNNPDFISAIDHEGIAAFSDGTLVVCRCWEDDNYALRRFDSTGKRVPLWPGSNDDDLSKKRVEWDELMERPARPPDGAWIADGPKGTLYFIERKSGRFTGYDREGGLRENVRPNCKEVEKIQDCAVSGEGCVYILFDHKEKINDINFSHVGMINTDGSFLVLAGPHARKNNYSLGTDMERISVEENGEIHLCDRGFDNFRILDPDGSVIWRSPATEKEDSTRKEELAEALASREGPSRTIE